MRPMILGPFSCGGLRNRSRWYRYRVLHLQTRWCFKSVGPELLQHVNVSAHFVFVGAEDELGVFVDESGFVGFEQRLIETVPAECAACFDDFLKSAILAFAVKKCFS